MTGRDLDAVAVDAIVRRLAQAAGAPWLHREVARRMGERLAPIRAEPARILDWWAGPGGGESVLRAIYPKAQVVAVEPDARWLARRTQIGRRPWWSLSRSHAPDARSAADVDDAALGRVPMIWANMMLHGVVDPPALFARWHALLEIDGFVAFSCLGPGSLRELRDLYAAMHWPAPTPGFIDMHDLGDMLVAAGFAEPVLDQETLRLQFANAEALLRELRQIGGNAAPGRFQGLRTRAWRQQLEAALGARAGSAGKITLSFEVAYGHGFKPAPRARPGEPVAVSLEAMRAMVRRPPVRADRVR